MRIASLDPCNWRANDVQLRPSATNVPQLSAIEDPVRHVKVSELWLYLDRAATGVRLLLKDFTSISPDGAGADRSRLAGTLAVRGGVVVSKKAGRLSCVHPGPPQAFRS